jgi:predicted outer membrane repeat protein
MIFINLKGGALYMSSNSSAFFTFASIANNNAKLGGGIYCENSKVSFSKHSFIGNNGGGNLLCNHCKFNDQSKQCTCKKC